MAAAKNLFFTSLLFTAFNMSVYANFPDFSLDVALKNSDELAINGSYVTDSDRIQFEKPFLQNDQSTFRSLYLQIQTKDRKHECGSVYAHHDPISEGKYNLRFEYFPHQRDNSVCNKVGVKFSLYDFSAGKKFEFYADYGRLEQSLQIPAPNSVKFQVQIEANDPSDDQIHPCTRVINIDDNERKDNGSH